MAGRTNLRAGAARKTLMKIRTTGLLLLALLFAGCWQKSVHPFYLPKDIVAEPKLVGTWTEKKDGDKMIWTFNDATNASLDLVIRTEKEKLDYIAHVFRLDGARYLDLFNAGPREISTLPVHHLFRLDEVGTTLKVTPLNINWVQKWLAKNPGALAYISVVDPEHRDDRDSDERVLTADTKALQSFLRTHAKDEEFLGDAVTFMR